MSKSGQTNHQSLWACFYPMANPIIKTFLLNSSRCDDPETISMQESDNKTARCVRHLAVDGIQDFSRSYLILGLASARS